MIFVLKTMKILKVIKNSHFQNETGCKTVIGKMSFIRVEIKNHFHMNGFALSLALKQKIGATLRWPIQYMERT